MAKIAGVAALVGLMLAAIVGMAVGHAPRQTAVAALTQPAPAISTERLARCRTLTTVETECADAWDAERRRFFGDDAR